MSMAFKCNLFLYDDDTCLVFQSKNVKDIVKQLKVHKVKRFNESAVQVSTNILFHNFRIRL